MEMQRMMTQATLAALTAMVCAAAQAQQLPAAEAPKTLHMAFPKAYNKLETWRLYGGFVNHLSQCTKMQILSQNGKELISAYDSMDLLPDEKMMQLMRENRLQLTQVSTGQVPVAVDTAQGVPFAARGDAATGKVNSYRVLLIVRASSPYQKPADLAGHKIAHATPGSNSGNLAPRAYFPSLGLEPDKNYTVVYSNGHERSIIGTQYGFWDGAAVASDQFDRMVRKGEIHRADFRTLWSSDPFPASAWVMSGALPAATQQLIRKCTASYHIPPAVSALLDGSDQFVPVDAAKDYAAVRFVAENQQKAAAK